MLDGRRVIAHITANDRAEAEGEGGGRAERQRTVDGLEPRSVIAFQDTYNEPAHRQRHGIIAARLNCRVSMDERCMSRVGVKPPSQVPLLMAPSEQPVNGGIIWLKPQ